MPEACPNKSLCALVYKDFALPGVIGRTHDAFLLHPLDDGGGAIIADLQPALDVARGRLAVAEDDLDGLLVEIAAFSFTEGTLVEYRTIFVVGSALFLMTLCMNIASYRLTRRFQGST